MIFGKKIWFYIKHSFVLNGELTVDKYKEISKDFDNAIVCSKTIEKFNLIKFTKYVVREKNILKIKLKNNKWQNFIDVNDDTLKNFKSYTFQYYYLDLGFFLIAANYNENGEYFLINDVTGILFKIDSIPIISPKRNFFIEELYQYDSPYCPYGLVVYRILKNSIRTITEINPDNWGPDDIKWLDSKTFTFKKNYREDIFGESLLKDIILNEKVVYEIKNDAFIIKKNK